MQYILLDLNYTLAESISLNIGNFSYDVSKDVYSHELVNKINQTYPEKKIFLVTARTDNYKEETIKKIESELDLEIYHYEFKPFKDKFLPVHEFKAQFVENLIKQQNLSPKQFIAIESNANTKAKFKALGIEEVYTRKEFLNK